MNYRTFLDKIKNIRGVMIKHENFNKKVSTYYLVPRFIKNWSILVQKWFNRCTFLPFSSKLLIKTCKILYDWIFLAKDFFEIDKRRYLILIWVSLLGGLFWGEVRGVQLPPSHSHCLPFSTKTVLISLTSTLFSKKYSFWPK